MTLSSLISRVEEGDGADRELDRAVMNAFYVEEDRFIGARYVDNDEPVLDRVWVDPATSQWVTTAPYEFTASLDRVVSLIEQKLPGWGYDLTYRAAWGNCCASVCPNHKHAPFYRGEVAPAKSPARALLAACLRALSALENSPAGLADAHKKDRP